MPSLKKVHKTCTFILLLFSIPEVGISIFFAQKNVESLVDKGKKAMKLPLQMGQVPKECRLQLSEHLGISFSTYMGLTLSMCSHPFEITQFSALVNGNCSKPWWDN